MAKLTRRQLTDLEHVLYHAKRAQAYLADPSVAVCRSGGPATTSLHYTRADGTGGSLYPVDKEIGSDLTGLPESIRLLESFLTPNPSKD